MQHKCASSSTGRPAKMARLVTTGERCPTRLVSALSFRPGRRMTLASELRKPIAIADSGQGFPPCATRIHPATQAKVGAEPDTG